MAQIDLKNATIKIKDGYASSGTFPASPPAVGAVGPITMAAITGIIPTNTYFTVAGDLTVYRVVSHIETLGNTTSITFTPGLTVQPGASAVVTFGPNQLEVRIGTGNASYSEKRKIDYELDRGRLYTVKLGDEEPVDVRLDFVWEFLRGATADPPTIEDALKQRGNASNWITSAADPCEPYAVDIEINYVPPCVDIDTELIILSDFRYEELAHDLRQGQVSITGKCNIVQAAVTRVAAA